MAFHDENVSPVITYPTFSELHSILSQTFDVLSYGMEYGMPTFTFRWPAGDVPPLEQQDTVFAALAKSVEPLRVWPYVRWYDKDEGVYFIRFIPEQQASKSDVTINYALFVATLATIAMGGFMQATSPVFLSLFYPSGWSVWDIVFTTGIFMLALMGIIFTHEMGHYMTAKRRGIEATPPYFIPGLPWIGGTFGAFIQQKSPPMNRRDLFDLGVAGPLAGFAVTLVVLVIGFLMSVPVTPEEVTAIEATYPNMTGSLDVPYLFVLMELLFSDFIPPGGTLYLHPVAFAAWVGMLVTALNLFPISQLDGGHALRSIVGPRYHKMIGWIALAIMFLAGYFLMAILILAISGNGTHPGPLNDTVPVDKRRIALFVLAMIVLVLCIPPLWNSLGLF